MIFRYSIRSIFAQRGASAIAVLLLSSTAAVLTVLLGLLDGLTAAIRSHGDPRVAIVYAEGQDEEAGPVPLLALNRVRAFDGIAIVQGRALLSSELVATVPFVRVDGQLDAVRFRGVDAVALDARSGLRVRGRLPSPAERGVVLGARLLGSRPGFEQGGRVQIGDQVWPVLGVLDAPDTSFESEVWADRTQLRQALRRTDDTVAYVRLQSEDAQASFQAGVFALHEHLVASSERDYLRAQTVNLSRYIDAVYALVAVLTVSMVLMGANAIYTSFLGRLVEIATLMAIGFTRRRVMAMIMVESVLLTCIGAGAGVALAMLANGYRVSLEEVATLYVVQIGARVVTIAAGVAISTGLIASIVAAVQIARVNVLEGLRN